MYKCEFDYIKSIINRIFDIFKLNKNVYSISKKKNTKITIHNMCMRLLNIHTWIQINYI